MEKIFLVAAAFFFLGALSGSHAERKASAVELRLRRLQIAAWLHDVATRIRRPGRPPIDLHDSLSSPNERGDLARLLEEFSTRIDRGCWTPGAHAQHGRASEGCECVGTLEETVCALHGCRHCK